MKVHLVLGAPGSGKGSLAELIGAKFALTHVSTGDILRDSVSKGTEVGLKVRDCMANGTLVDDETVNGMVFARLLEETGDVLFDGYPRTLKQATALDGFLAERGSRYGVVLYIDVPAAVLETRIVGRRVCRDSSCGAIFHITRKAPRVEGVCDRCGGGLAHRADDSPEAFRVRMDVFKTSYEPMLRHYMDNPNFRQVGGLGLPAEVFEAVHAFYGETA